MVRIFVSVFIVMFVVSGCSFSKEDEVGTQPLAESSLSERQNNILTAVRENRTSLLKQYLVGVELADLDFPPDKSPIAIALESDSFEIMKVLVSTEINLFNTGSVRDSFNFFVVARAMESFVLRLDYAVVTNEEESARDVLANAQYHVILKVFERFKSSGSADAYKFAQDLRVDLSLLEFYTVVAAQNGDAEILRLLVENNISEMKPAYVQALYEAELLSDAIEYKLGEESPVLTYLSKHKFLKNKMWNISGSGFYVSRNGLQYLLSKIVEERDRSSTDLPVFIPSVEYKKGDFIQVKRDRIVEISNPKTDYILTQIKTFLFEGERSLDKSTLAIKVKGLDLGSAELEVPGSPFVAPDRKSNPPDLD